MPIRILKTIKIRPSEINNYIFLKIRVNLCHKILYDESKEEIIVSLKFEYPFNESLEWNDHLVGIAGSSNSKKIENNQFYFDAYILMPDEKGTHYISHNGIYLHILNEKCTTLSHKSCIMKFGKKSILQEEKKGDRDGTIQLYNIFVF